MGGSDQPNLRGCSGVFRQYRSKHSFILGQHFDQQVEDPLKISEKRGMRPQNFDPSMRLQALSYSFTHVAVGVCMQCIIDNSSCAIRYNVVM
jgi:hypothetical protein